jgi:hypothetical protein
VEEVDEGIRNLKLRNVKVTSFEELVIWQKAIEIGIEIYSLADLSALKNDYKSRDWLVQ